MISPLSQENIDNGLKSSFDGTKSGICSLAFIILSRIKMMQHINYDSKQWYSIAWNNLSNEVKTSTALTEFRLKLSECRNKPSNYFYY